MKIRKLQAAIVAASFAFACAANAQIYFSGSFGTFNEGGGSYTASSVTLLADNYVNGSIAGDFVGILPQYSLITTYASTISGLSSFPAAENINDFFQIASPGNPYGLYNGAGTSPANRFDFNLATLAETAYYGGSGAVFVGTGMLVDTTGYYADTPASFTLSFSGPGSYSFSFASAAPVPEPATMAMLAGGCLLLVIMLRRARTA